MPMDVAPKLKELVKKSLEELVKDKVKLLLEFCLLIAIGAILSIFKRYLLDILYTEIQIWKGIGLLILLSCAYVLAKYIISKKKYDVTRFGLLWKIGLIKNKVISLRGPFCPDCDCDVSHTLRYINAEGGAIVCPKCQREYPIRYTSTKKIKDDVKQIIESDLKSNKVLDVDWSLYGFENSYFKVKNKGIFEVIGVNIHVSINFNEDKKIVGKYCLGDFSPLESKVLEEELAKDIKNLLVTACLIKIYSVELPEDIENEYGEIETVFLKHEYVNLNKNFSISIFVDLTYNLEKKQKAQRNTFLLKLISKNWRPYEYYNYYEDDCKITLEKIN